MTAVNLATADLFQAEIARLQAEIERLRLQPCPYVTGNVTRHCTLTPFTLTPEEREAVEAILVDADSAWSADNAAALRGLLERCSQFAKRESDRPQPIECTPEPHATPGEGSVQGE